jgi:hypothetical protein
MDTLIILIAAHILFNSISFQASAQIKTLEQVRHHFGPHWFDDPDSMMVDPSRVIGIHIVDSCNAENFLYKFDTVLSHLINTEYLILSGTDCFDNSRSTISRFLVLSKINTIDESWACIPTNTIFPDHLRQNLINLACRAPDNDSSRQWLQNLFQLANLRDLNVFLRGDTRIDSITTLKKLERLYLNGTGDIIFPENFYTLYNLKEIEINHCLTCRSFSEILPDSVEAISIYNTRIDRLCKNLSSLKNLKHLNIACSKVKSFPKDFNFKQLTFFSANEALFTPDEWNEIERQVRIVRRDTTYYGTQIKNPIGKRHK